MHDTDILLIHTAVTWALVGLIWTIQLVQYPGFAHVGPAQFSSFHEHHSSRITWIVAPLMVGELLTAIALLGNRPVGISQGALWAGLALIGLNWTCTAFVAVPLHKRLSGRDPRPQGALVATNWIHTITWSARGAWTLLAMRGALQGQT